MLAASLGPPWWQVPLSQSGRSSASRDRWRVDLPDLQQPGRQLTCISHMYEVFCFLRIRYYEDSGRVSGMVFEVIQLTLMSAKCRLLTDQVLWWCTLVLNIIDHALCFRLFKIFYANCIDYKVLGIVFSSNLWYLY